ncbi:MAG: ribose 5-phosphate isomerase B [bacterium]
MDFGERITQEVGKAFGSEPVKIRFEIAKSASERLPGKMTETYRVAVGGDHRGSVLKKMLLSYLKEMGHVVVDCGISDDEPADYPDIALRVAEKVARKICEFGILIDAVGIGSAIAANKIKGIRAAVCYDIEAARSSRLHNDANVLSLGANFVNRGLARRIVKIWLETPFEGGRHARRLAKIEEIERNGLDARLSSDR